MPEERYYMLFKSYYLGEPTPEAFYHQKYEKEEGSHSKRLTKATSGSSTSLIASLQLLRLPS